MGDYWTDPNGIEHIRCSESDDWRYDLLILVHEIVEDYLCQHRGIQEPAIKAFDELYERERTAGLHSAADEPGFDVRAPYRKEHQFATAIEMLLANELDVDWLHYLRSYD